MKIILIIAILLILIIYYFNIESKIINKLIRPHNILCKVSKQNNQIIIESNPMETKPKQNNKTIMETQNMCLKRDITTLEKYNNNLPYKSMKDTSKPYYHSELDYIDKSEINCCLIEKKYLPSDNSIYGGNFKYIFEKKKNDECNKKLYDLNSNKQILIVGDNGWSNDNCSADEKKNMQSIGSCRNINKECIDFVDKSYCDKSRMTWSELTCNNSLPYKWIDKLKPAVNDKTNLGAVNFFPVF
jgi:hypothetical protein